MAKTNTTELLEALAAEIGENIYIGSAEKGCKANLDATQLE